jgi:hypothetical protein
MGPPSYMQSFVAQNVVLRFIPVFPHVASTGWFELYLLFGKKTNLMYYAI